MYIVLLFLSFYISTPNLCIFTHDRSFKVERYYNSVGIIGVYLINQSKCVGICMVSGVGEIFNGFNLWH